MKLFDAVEIVKEMEYNMRRQACVEVTMRVSYYPLDEEEEQSTKVFRAVETERQADALRWLLKIADAALRGPRG